MTTQNKYVGVILAAGASARLGQPKQLLQNGNISLLQNAINAAIGSKASVIIVVTNKEISSLISQKEKIIIVINEHPETGMSSSIKTGIEKLLQTNESTEAAIIMLCDQPFVTASILDQLIMQHEQTQKPLIAAAYSGTIGTPALFQKKYFQQLLSLEGDSGAKKIIQQHLEELATIDFPEGSIDIDTPGDLQKWKALNQ